MPAAPTAVHVKALRPSAAGPGAGPGTAACRAWRAAFPTHPFIDTVPQPQSQMSNADPSERELGFRQFEI